LACREAIPQKNNIENTALPGSQSWFHNNAKHQGIDEAAATVSWTEQLIFLKNN
jgi:hypothetical protein